MNRRARAAIDRALDRSEAERLVTGKPIDPSSPLFPSPCDRNKPVDSKGPPCQWLLKAEKMANLKKQDGTLWHGYRRGWATARKELPAKDVAQAGGWKSPTVLELCYQQATDAGVLAVVMAKEGESG